MSEYEFIEVLRAAVHPRDVSPDKFIKALEDFVDYRIKLANGEARRIVHIPEDEWLMDEEDSATRIIKDEWR